MQTVTEYVDGRVEVTHTFSQGENLFSVVCRSKPSLKLKYFRCSFRSLDTQESAVFESKRKKKVTREDKTVEGKRVCLILYDNLKAKLYHQVNSTSRIKFIR